MVIYIHSNPWIFFTIQSYIQELAKYFQNQIKVKTVDLNICVTESPTNYKQKKIKYPKKGTSMIWFLISFNFVLDTSPDSLDLSVKQIVLRLIFSEPRIKFFN